jgi:hypothetical protein
MIFAIIKKSTGEIGDPCGRPDEKEVGGSSYPSKEKESVPLDKNCCTQLTIYNGIAFLLITSTRISGSVLLKAPLTSYMSSEAFW